jgi:hypothetical protein
VTLHTDARKHRLCLSSHGRDRHVVRLCNVGR